MLHVFGTAVHIQLSRQPRPEGIFHAWQFIFFVLLIPVRHYYYFQHSRSALFLQISHLKFTDHTYNTQ